MEREKELTLVTLVGSIGNLVLLGVVATAIAFLYPIDTESVGKGVLDSIRLFLTTWKQYLLLPVALLAIAMSMVLMSGKRGKSIF